MNNTLFQTIMILIAVLFFRPAKAGKPRYNFKDLQINAPASGERFHATKRWQAIEPIAWNIATEHKLRGWMRRIFMIIIWNESRGHYDVMGDAGCAYGLMQLHVGGCNDDGKRCTADNRRLFPEYLQIPSAYFINPTINLQAGAIKLLLSKKRGSAFSASARYAGCAPNGQCARRLWGRHKWWWQTGLRKRIIMLEEKETH